MCNSIISIIIITITITITIITIASITTTTNNNDNSTTNNDNNNGITAALPEAARSKTFLGMVMGYAVYYFTRLSFTIVL